MNYPSLLDWACEAKLISQTAGRELKQRALRNRAQSQAVLKTAIRIREMLFAIFSAIATEKEISPGLIRELARWTSEAFSHLALSPNHQTWQWKPQNRQFNFVLWPVILAAVELLRSRDVAQVTQCEARDCDWLFIDRSRKKNRRWCDMKVCGNREKARRFNARKRKGKATKSRLD